MLSIRQPFPHTSTGLNYGKNDIYVHYSRPQRERAENVTHIRKQISISITIVQACNGGNVNKNQIVSSVSAKQIALYIIASFWLVIIHGQKITCCHICGDINSVGDIIAVQTGLCAICNCIIPVICHNNYCHTGWWTAEMFAPFPRDAGGPYPLQNGRPAVGPV